MKKDGYTWEDFDKAWWEGFDTCKAKAGEENVKLNDELEKLKKQLEELPDKWCRNKDDYCPHLAKLEKENQLLKAEVKLWKAASENNSYKAFQLQKENAELKELIKNIIRVTWGEGWNYSLDWKVKAELFLNSEVEK